jgi:hypothetical protein
MTKKFATFVAGLVIAVPISDLAASTITLDATGLGSFESPLGYNFLSGPIEVGIHEFPIPPMGLPYVFRDRGFLTFDLSGVSQTVLSATLQVTITSFISQGPGVGFPIPTITHTTEPFGVFSYSNSPSTLLMSYGNPDGFPPAVNPAGLAIYNDLGGGTQYGDFTASASVIGSVLNVPLNAAAISAINAAAGQSFAAALVFIGSEINPGLGGQLGAPLDQQFITLDAGVGPEHLVLVTNDVPEPAMFLLMTIGSISVACYGYVVKGCVKNKNS